MTLQNFNLADLKEKLLNNQHPKKLLYQWVKTGHISYFEFENLLDIMMIDEYNKQQQRKVDVGNPDQFL